MKKKSHRIGYFFAALLPFIAVEVLGFGVTFLVSVPEILGQFLSESGQGAFRSWLQNISSQNLNAVIMLIYSLLVILILGSWYQVVRCRRRRQLTEGVSYYALERSQESGVSGRRYYNVKILLSFLLLTVSMQLLCTYLVAVIAAIRPEWFQSYTTMLESARSDGWFTVLTLIYSVIGAPIGEEIIFRGLTLHYAGKSLPFWAANIMQALLFGIYHMNLLQGIYAFLLGMVLGYVAHTGGIYLSITLHMMFNVFGTFLSGTLTVLDKLGGIANFAALVISAIVFVTALGLFRRGWKTLNQRN